MLIQQLLVTVQLLQIEFSQLSRLASKTLGTSKVAVVCFLQHNCYSIILLNMKNMLPKTNEKPAMKEVKETVLG